MKDNPVVAALVLPKECEVINNKAVKTAKVHGFTESANASNVIGKTRSNGFAFASLFFSLRKVLLNEP